MKLKIPPYKRPIYLMFFSVLCLLIYSSSIGIAVGQKKPKTLKLDVDMDDKILCQQSVPQYTRQQAQSQSQQVQSQGIQFCDLFTLYDANKDGNEIGKRIALNARNDMIDLVVGQVDTYFKQRKDGRRTRIRFYQSVLDFLRIGGELAVTIMNGERAKTIVGASLAALNTGSTRFDENFQIIQTQVLINKMLTRRAEILTEIIRSKDKPVRATNASDAYSWYQAKNDLRRYLLAGTFNDALDTLVQETGADVERAENVLKAVSRKDVNNSLAANSNILSLKKALENANTKDASTKILRAIVTRLQQDPEISARLTVENITPSSEGEAIRLALVKIRGDFIEEDREDLVIKINEAILAEGVSLG